MILKDHKFKLVYRILIKEILKIQLQIKNYSPNLWVKIKAMVNKKH